MAGRPLHGRLVRCPGRLVDSATMLTVTEGLLLADRYEVEHQLGQGGSASVWRAHDRVLDRTVAVKVVPDGIASERLAREARATAGIGVRNVVAVYDVGEQDGAHFLVMEYVEGVDLATLVDRTGPLGPALAAVVGHDVARGLAAVHGAGLVHRDVTPGNVLVTTEGEVKLADLGIAQRTGDGEATKQLTQTGAVVGTVDYLSPEQVEGGDVTAASDVYTAGLLLHTVITGAAPFGSGTVAERLARRLASDPPPLEDHPLAEVVARATRRAVEDRPADGEALREALAAHTPSDATAQRDELRELVAGARDQATAPSGATEVLTDQQVASAEQGDRTQVVGGAAAAGAGTAAPGSGADAGSRAGVGAVAGDGAGGRDGTRVIQRAGADDGSAAGGGGDDPAGNPQRRLLMPLALGLVAVVGAIAVVTALTDGDQEPSGDPTEEDLGQLTLVSADDHDPLGGGGEHGDEVPLAIDGDPETAWTTEGYENRPDLGGLKDGVGLLVELDAVQPVRAVEIDMALDGVDVTVTVSAERPQGDPTQEATVLGSQQDAGGEVVIEGDEPVEGRWVAVWFTSLAPDGTGDFSAAVAEVRVRGE